MPVPNFERTLLRNTLEVDSLALNVRDRIMQRLQDTRLTILDNLKKLPQSAKFTRFHNQQILGQIDGYFNLQKTTTLREVGIARKGIIKKEYEETQAALFKDAKETLPVDTTIPVKTVVKLEGEHIGGRTLAEWTSKQEASLANGMKSVLSQAVILGESLGTVTKKMRDQFALSRKSATVLARTTLLQASSSARDELYDENKDIIESYTYLATLDDRTCLICAPDDGATEKKREDLPTLLRHPQCRCIIKANTKFTEVGTRPSVTEVERHKVHHRDGSTSTRFRNVEAKLVPGKTTFQDFFNGQSKQWQKDYLGPRKFALHKQGRLSLKDMRSQKTKRIFTIKDLERKVGAPKAVASVVKPTTKPVTATRPEIISSVDWRQANITQEEWQKVYQQNAVKGNIGGINIFAKGENIGTGEIRTEIKRILTNPRIKTGIDRGKETLKGVTIKNSLRVKAISGRSGPAFYQEFRRESFRKFDETGKSTFVTETHKAEVHIATKTYSQQNNRFLRRDLIIKEGGLKPVQDLGGTIRHELGHHIHHNASQELKKEFMGLVNAKYLSRAQSGIINDVLDWDRLVKPVVGRYSGTNIMELFAESFTVFTHPKYGQNNNILPLPLHEFFEKHFGV